MITTHWEFEYRTPVMPDFKRYGSGVRAAPGGPKAASREEAEQFLRERVNGWVAGTELRLIEVVTVETPVLTVRSEEKT